jgi:hypothetical protein
MLDLIDLTSVSLEIDFNRRGLQELIAAGHEVSTTAR